MDFRHSTSPSSSISSSASSSPVSIGWPSPTGSMVASSRQEFTSSRSLNCAYPSWPTGDSLSSFGSTAPSSFISDEDLFLDDEQYYLYEAPAPPRPAPLPVAMPLLPLYASEKPKKKQHYAQPDQQRRRNSRKQRHPSKPMTPISESPETVPEFFDQIIPGNTTRSDTKRGKAPRNSECHRHVSARTKRPVKNQRDQPGRAQAPLAPQSTIAPSPTRTLAQGKEREQVTNMGAALAACCAATSLRTDCPGSGRRTQTHTHAHTHAIDCAPMFRRGPRRGLWAPAAVWRPCVFWMGDRPARRSALRRAALLTAGRGDGSDRRKLNATTPEGMGGRDGREC